MPQEALVSSHGKSRFLVCRTGVTVEQAKRDLAARLTQEGGAGSAEEEAEEERKKRRKKKNDRRASRGDEEVGMNAVQLLKEQHRELLKITL